MSTRETPLYHLQSADLLLRQKPTEVLDPQRLGFIADLIIHRSLHIQPDDTIFIKYQPGAVQLAAIVANKAYALGSTVLTLQEDPRVQAKVLSSPTASDYDYDKLVEPYKRGLTQATKLVNLNSNNHPDLLARVPVDVLRKFYAALRPAIEEAIDAKPWVGLYIPTKKEAAREGMSFSEYVEMFFSACERPWADIENAQQILIDDYLNPGEVLEIIAGSDLDPQWQTHLTMSIKGQTFANSTIEKNIPGSEVFSSPVAYSTNGRLAIPYPIMFKGRILPGLILEIENGKVISFDIPHGGINQKKWVTQILETDKGARQIGEIAFGTNNAFGKLILNPYYVEKIAGSFHIALGKSFTETTYQGKPVHINNSNKSLVHIDLTCILLAQYGGGKVLVDGQTIQENGIFVDDRLALLNP